MAQAKQDMGSGSVKKLMLQLMIPAVVAQGSTCCITSWTAFTSDILPASARQR